MDAQTLARIFCDIPGHETFLSWEPLDKGWSSEQKYRIQTQGGTDLLLRVSECADYARKKMEYDMLLRMATLGISLSFPVSFGLCNGGQNVYSLLGWCEGTSADEALPNLSAEEQYAVGYNAGKALKKLHSLPAPETAMEWSSRFRQKLDAKYAYLNENGIADTATETLKVYLEDNFFLLHNRPQCFNHGDYNIGNLIVGDVLRVGVIDPNCYNLGYGDPYWEFAAVVWEQELREAYYCGFINGYFESEPPKEFFPLFAYYFAYAALSAFCEAHEMEIDRAYALAFAEETSRWFDGFQNPVPCWYENGKTKT